jgi:hypothetical protein
MTLAADPVAGLTFEKRIEEEGRRRLGIVLRNWNVGVEPEYGKSALPKL